MHSHINVPAAAALVAPYMNMMDVDLFKFASELTRSINAGQERDRNVALTDVKDRIAVMDAMGINLQVIAPAPLQSYYWLPSDVAVPATRLVNDGIAEFVAARNDRLVGLGSVPLSEPDEAVAELERCIGQLGFKGVQILTNVNGREISDPDYSTFWKRAEELDALVMLHPNGFTHADRFRDNYFVNVIGNPLDTTVALHSIIFSGLLEEMPALKILAVHGGGYLPAYSGRIDHAWGAREDSGSHLPQPPSSYLRKIFFDSVVFTSHQLEYLIKVFGSDHVVMGTDYPYDMADFDPVGHISLSDLLEQEKRDVAGLTALKLLSISS
jgi:aminocarboxymuconate-semialdehyde decarboxylase